MARTKNTPNTAKQQKQLAGNGKPPAHKNLGKGKRLTVAKKTPGKKVGGVKKPHRYRPGTVAL